MSTPPTKQGLTANDMKALSTVIDRIQFLNKGVHIKRCLPGRMEDVIIYLDKMKFSLRRPKEKEPYLSYPMSSFSRVLKGHNTHAFLEHQDQPLSQSFSLYRGESTFDFVAESESVCDSIVEELELLIGKLGLPFDKNNPFQVRLHSLWIEADSDGNNSLDYKEIVRVTSKALNLKLSAKEMKSRFEEADTDGSQSIEWQEFINMIYKNRSRDNIQRLFTKANTDKNPLMTVETFRKFLINTQHEVDPSNKEMAGLQGYPSLASTEFAEDMVRKHKITIGDLKETDGVHVVDGFTFADYLFSYPDNSAVHPATIQYPGEAVATSSSVPASPPSSTTLEPEPGQDSAASSSSSSSSSASASPASPPPRSPRTVPMALQTRSLGSPRPSPLTFCGGFSSPPLVLPDGVLDNMDFPLSFYFINTSHNTYLTGNQLTGKSAAEMYANVLRRGLRCVELDIWENTSSDEKGDAQNPFSRATADAGATDLYTGPPRSPRLSGRTQSLSGLENEPVIYHGHTLTSKIYLREVVATIRDNAFVSSPLPVILSLEMHCSKQKELVARIFAEELGEALFRAQDYRKLVAQRATGGEPGAEGRTTTSSSAAAAATTSTSSSASSSAPSLDSLLVTEEDWDILPSPNELRGKVILRTDSPSTNPRGKQLKPEAATLLLAPSATSSKEEESSDEEDVVDDELAALHTAQELQDLEKMSEKDRRKKIAEWRAQARKQPQKDAASSQASPASPLPGKGRKVNPMDGVSFFCKGKFAKNFVDTDAVPAHAMCSYTEGKVEKYIKGEKVKKEKDKKSDKEVSVFSSAASFIGRIMGRSSATSTQTQLALHPLRFLAHDPNFVSYVFGASNILPLHQIFCNTLRQACLRHTLRHLLRVYPKGSRFFSSNYNPIPAWRCGCQLVALNMQTFDSSVLTAAALFSQNKNCGYILRPPTQLRQIVLMLKKKALNGSIDAATQLYKISATASSLHPSSPAQPHHSAPDPHSKSSLQTISFSSPAGQAKHQASAPIPPASLPLPVTEDAELLTTYCLAAQPFPRNDAQTQFGNSLQNPPANLPVVVDPLFAAPVLQYWQKYCRRTEQYFSNFSGSSAPHEPFLPPVCSLPLRLNVTVINGNYLPKPEGDVNAAVVDPYVTLEMIDLSPACTVGDEFPETPQPTFEGKATNSSSMAVAEACMADDPNLSDKEKQKLCETNKALATAKLTVFGATPPFKVEKTPVVDNNGLNPKWETPFAFSLVTSTSLSQLFPTPSRSAQGVPPPPAAAVLAHLDHIASLSLRVCVWDQQLSGNKLIGLNVLPLRCLREGYRFVPLLGTSGQLLLPAGLLCNFNFV